MRELAERRGDLRPLVRHNSMLDVKPLRLQQPDEERTALVLAVACRDAVGDGDHRGLQSGSFVFWTRVTSDTDISGSIAFAMS